MKITSILSPDDIIMGLKADSKKQLLECLVRRIEDRQTGIKSRAILDLLTERERLGCTGIGGGIAIPHARYPLIEGGNKPLTQLAILNKPIDFQAYDDQYVDIVFMLIAPDNRGGEHLATLALASRTLRDKTRAERLRQATSREMVWEALNDMPISSAA